MDCWQELLYDIPQYSSFLEVKPIDKGWSSDRKFHIMAVGGQELLLRVSPFSRYHQRQSQFRNLERLAAYGIPASRPMAFGICGSGQHCYQLLTWVHGEDAENIIPNLTDSEQFNIGISAGKILRKIHSLPAPDDIDDWLSRLNGEIVNIMQNYVLYRDNSKTSETGEVFYKYLKSHDDALIQRSQSYRHGDFHIGNLIIDDDRNLFVIDWNMDSFGDPWQDFTKILYNSKAGSHFASGEVYGYFNGNPPDRFWRLLAFYTALNQLEIISWTHPLGKEADFVERQHKETLDWYNNMQNLIPSWYLLDYCNKYKETINVEENRMSLFDDIKKREGVTTLHASADWSTSDPIVITPRGDMLSLIRDGMKYLHFDTKVYISMAPDGNNRLRYGTISVECSSSDPGAIYHPATSGKYSTPAYYTKTIDRACPANANACMLSHNVFVISDGRVAGCNSISVLKKLIVDYAARN
ncbi:MAG: phosphotransferase [Coriobacteriia bacterium]|nr:phosphotransferase [Coriobacteriia bacterium]